jgi:starch-binding outer membrane protein, SusD/RagB family
MKRYLYILLATITVGGSSCNKDFLDEKPESFLSTSNAYAGEADFNAAVNGIYGLVRNHYYTVNDFNPFWYMYRTDAYFDITVTTPNLSADIAPTGITNFAWAPHYEIISEANTILSRLPNSTLLTDAQKKLFEAKAKFFRGLAYRALGYLYGGVPLVLEEVTNQKALNPDFTRASRTEVYAQAIEDLKFAAANLPDIKGNLKKGEVSSVAANHLLAEVYLADKQYQNAANAATAVINNPAMGLMTTRFGRRSTVSPGDVYWDLFQRGNQNAAENREAIWVIQIETDIPGGGGSTTGGSQFGVYGAERVHAPLVRDLKSKVGSEQIALFNWPMGDYSGGRGVGFLCPSNWFSDSVWANDFNNDIRNANHNFVRDFIATNPKSPYYGKVVSTKNPPADLTGVSGAIVAGKKDRAFYPYQSKATQPYDHPAALYDNLNVTDPVQKYLLKSGAGGLYIDQYMMRLAETYLLRAEAYVGLNQQALAAADINKVRSRAGASDVLPANVTLDYILDERLRELGIEEKRMLTLMRMGKWVERTRKYNPFYGTQMKDHYNLWPIPFGEIEKNNKGVLEQNPNYN